MGSEIVPLCYQCHRGSPALSGRGDDASWVAADWTAYFVDIEGIKRPLPRFKTRAKMLWDDEAFYVYAWLEEPCVWATLTEHDSVVFQDNDFEVFVDPDGDALRYFEFEVNAFGTTWDLFLDRPYRDGGTADNSWESHAQVKVHIDGEINDPAHLDQGWSVELAFPWTSFIGHSRPRPGDVWRVNFSRVQWQVDIIGGKIAKRLNTPEDNWVWSSQGVIDMHQPEMWGKVEFCL